MRFRHKLSIVLVGLALIPLVAAGLLVARLLEHDQVSKVDARLSAAALAGDQAFQTQQEQAKAAAIAIASHASVQQVLLRRDKHKLTEATLQGMLPPEVADSGLTVTLYTGKNARMVGGDVPASPYWQGRASLENCKTCVAAVAMPLDAALADALSRGGVGSDIQQFGIVAAGHIVGFTGTLTGPVTGIGGDTSQAKDVRIAGTSFRVQALPITCDKDSEPCYLIATYPRSALDDAIDSQRLRILVPLILLALLVGVLAFAAADWMSRALNELAERAMALARGGAQGDELAQLGAAIDQISSELSSRVGELEAERGRFKETLQRYGETLAATHDLNALVGAVLDTAVQATRARGGRLLLYDAERGEAIEQARIGTARGSRTDLPMVVAAGVGIEGEALAGHEARVVQAPRAMLAVPILREHQLLGLVTTVDPEDGGFGDEDIESLSALAVQAGVAIENARLHRVVERQAVTDSLTGLANRRQFYEVLGREYERAQRFGTPLSLVLLDIDDFKQINDTRGHLAGDAVLHGVASTLADMIREIDMAARYGGEEFAILLPQTGQDGAAQLAERLRREIASRPIRFGAEEIEGVTASFGVAAGPEDSMTQIDLIASADAALYQAKREGKNHVTVAEAW